MQNTLSQQGHERNTTVYRIVTCLMMSAPFPVTPPSRDDAEYEPGFRSKSFQNFKLSSAAEKIISGHEQR
jgi:hypothetical protein